MMLGIVFTVFLILLLIFSLIVILVLQNNWKATGSIQDTYMPPPAPVYSYPIMICGIVYQCAPYLDAVFQNILRIVPFFSDYRIVIEIDEGKDASLSILESWKDKLHPHMILVEGKKSSTVRTENIAIARNMVLEQIRALVEKGFEPRFFIMMDMDNVCSSPIQLPVLHHVLDNEHVWDSVSFHRKPYYDLWALSYDPFYISCFHWKTNVVKSSIEKVTKKFNNLSPKEFFPVYSAFNGFAIYRTEIFLRCDYDWRFQSTQKFMTPTMLSKNKKAMYPNVFKRTMEMDCEHRFFHMSAIFDHGARIRVCPQLLFK